MTLHILKLQCPSVLPQDLYRNFSNFQICKFVPGLFARAAVVQFAGPIVAAAAAAFSGGERSLVLFRPDVAEVLEIGRRPAFKFAEVSTRDA